MDDTYTTTEFEGLPIHWMTTIIRNNDLSYEFDNKKEFDNHHSELYDSSKSYTKERFVYDFGKGKHTYYYKIVKVILMCDHIKELNYVIAEEIISKEELQELSQFCQCYICTSKWYNLLSYIMTRYQSGCLKTNQSFRQYIIDEARRLKSLKT